MNQMNHIFFRSNFYAPRRNGQKQRKRTETNRNREKQTETDRNGQKQTTTHRNVHMKRSRARVPIRGHGVLLQISLRIKLFDFF